MPVSEVDGEVVGSPRVGEGEEDGEGEELREACKEADAPPSEGLSSGLEVMDGEPLSVNALVVGMVVSETLGVAVGSAWEGDGVLEEEGEELPVAPLVWEASPDTLTLQL